MGRGRAAAFVGLVAMVVASVAGLSGAVGATASSLTRYPYLSDLVGTTVTVNWGTDRSATSGTVRWGAVDGSGNCTPTTSVTATRYPVTVNGVAEYQWTATLTLPTPGTYCYRPYLSTKDLLGTDGSPRFTTQATSEPFSFAVFGDWGQTDSTGANPDQANLLQQVARSGARFAVTVGDNGYNSASETNYGDLNQVGADVSDIFGPQFWTVPGRSLPLFAASGNHGISNTTTSTRSTEQLVWNEPTGVSTSGGRYQLDTYCCVNGTTSATYASSWYAFDAGPLRLYVLQADWANSNVGTGTVYTDDAAAHWAAGDPEYQWLVNDLAAHPGVAKLAFFHFPLYSDQKAQNSDTALRGASSLEGLLAQNDVKLIVNGHAHIYERNTGGLVPSYVTGGGGATLQPVGEVGCSSFDAYAIGWSPTKVKGSRCGAATVPDAATRVFHFLLFSVNGTQLTVTPTDELGRTFDVQTYAVS